MNCTVIPLVCHPSTEISYRLKCVAVESERVVGDVIVTPQTSAAELRPKRSKKRNLVECYLQSPNFLELNQSKDGFIRRSSIAVVARNDINRRVVFRNERSKSLDYPTISRDSLSEEDTTSIDSYEQKKFKIYPTPPSKKEQSASEVGLSSLVDQLLEDIYGSESVAEHRLKSESESIIGSSVWKSISDDDPYSQNIRLQRRSKSELRVLLESLREHVNHTGSLLIRQLRRRDYLVARREFLYDLVTTHLKARSAKSNGDTRMKFSLTPQPGESGFVQWLDAMKMVAKLQGGIPAEFRRKLWLTLAERHLEQRGVDWQQAEKVCFNEWSNPDDEELGIQIVKDLHRTGCSMFCGSAGRDNQAVLRRVLLGYARWNKSVGYCQGFNVLAALILQVVDREEAGAVKVMIYLIEGVLPEAYFADNLRGLSIDMAVFRDLLRMRLPRLSKHLESLQNDTKDKATGSSYEPPLTNVFTMQWFLTLFCHCLPQDAVLRVWDLIFLEGDNVLLRTALAIWEGISDRIMTVTSADEFYSIMGVLTREMLEFTDTNHLIKTIVSMGPLNGITNLREKHRYNITPWARRLSDDEESDMEDDERLTVAQAAAIFAMPRLKKTDRSTSSAGIQPSAAPASDRERLALDISTLKQQYAKLRERQRQAHIILSAACARQPIMPQPSASPAMNHLLIGKNALVSGKNRFTGPGANSLVARAKAATMSKNRKQQQQQTQQPPQQQLQSQLQQGLTLHWKDTKKRKEEREPSTDSIAVAVTAAEATTAPAAAEIAVAEPSEPAVAEVAATTTMTTAATRKPSSSGAQAADSDSDSTSTELCDEPDRLSDLDSEELTSSEHEPRVKNDETSPVHESSDHCCVYSEETSIAKITDQIRRLSADDADFKTSIDDSHPIDKIISPTLETVDTACSIQNKISTISKLYENEENNELVHVAENQECSKSSNGVYSSEIEATTIMKLFKDNDTVPSYDIPSTFEIAKTKHELKTELDKFDDLLFRDRPANNDLNETTITNSLEVMRISKSPYIIGHFPITHNEKQNRISPEVFSPKTSNSTKDPQTEKNDFSNSVNLTIASPDKKFSSYKFQHESKFSPKTPESTKSFSSGETMGPDSITSSLAATPLRSSESRDFIHVDKSGASSISSDSKTLTILSVESDIVRTNGSESINKQDEKEVAESPPREKSVTPSTDSLMRVKSTEPPCSSTESFCSPSKLKSSERSFSSELQSPISANSIKYTANYSYKTDLDLIQPISDIGPITSPFYPILNPNQKTPSPYRDEKSKLIIKNETEATEFRGIVQDRDTKYFIEKNKTSTQAFDLSQYRIAEENISIKISNENDDDIFHSNISNKNFSFNLENSTKVEEKASEKDVGRTSAFEIYRKNRFEDELQETDTLSPLPSSQFENRNAIFERSRGQSLDGKLETLEISNKSYDRTSSSLEKRFPEMLLSPSMEDFDSLKKRSSDVLEDLRHLETKTTEDGEIDPKMLTRKTSFIWEDLQSLEARRQDTFSDSASTFSRQRIDVPGISISTVGRKTYVVEPKINIDDSSDSILKSVTYKNSNGTFHNDADDGEDDDGEAKLGVWTKVKPRKRIDSGRRSNDRALKIMQENSAILQKILTCQARKRLPDLEEISKEITISPINEEISKIFSPILEKMGLNENEINEELARISFKDIDRGTTTTTASEFEAKINEELSKLSLIGDNDEVAYLPDVDDTSSDYLVARDAFIDRQMNEELSKILANYGKDSPMSLQKSSLHDSPDLSTSSTNISNYLPTLTTNSYQSSNDSLNIKNDLVPKESLHSTYYSDQSLVPYVARNDYSINQNISEKGDVDIYRELEKLDKISYSQALPTTIPTEIVHPDVIPKSSPYLTNIIRSPKAEYSPMIDIQPSYDLSPLKSPYNSPYSSMATVQPTSFDYKSRLSPRKQPSNPYSIRSYDSKSDMDTGFENSTFELTRKAMIPLSYNYEYGTTKKDTMSKERLEFRVKYNPEENLSLKQKPAPRDIDLKLSPLQTDVEIGKMSPYYSSDPVITPKHMYSAKKDDTLNQDRIYETSLQRRQYISESTSPAVKYSVYGENYDSIRQPYKISSLKSDPEMSSYLSTTAVNPNILRDKKILSPQYPYSDYAKSLGNSYATVSAVNYEDSISTSTNITKNSYPDISPTNPLYQRSNIIHGNIIEVKQVGNSDLKYHLDQSPSPKPLGFSPFPVRNVPRKPKDVAVKLGLYSPTNNIQSKRS